MRAGARAGRRDAILDRRRNFDKAKRVWAGFTLSALSAFMLAGCSSQNFTPETSYYTPTNYGAPHTEVASWYGPGFEWRRTSSGEIFNPEALTAASATLPLGSHVTVTNPDTGRSVVVRINDRGPFIPGRTLDLSHGAARQIGLTGKGVGRVEVTPTATSSPAASWRSAAYAESSAGTEHRHVSYVSYLPRFAHSTRRHTRHHYYHHYHSSRRIISDPIGAWLSSAFPRL